MNIKAYHSLFDAFRHSMLHNPDGSREDQWHYFLDKVRSDMTLVETLARDYFDRNFAQYKTARVGRSVTLVGTAPVARRAVTVAERQAAKSEGVKKIRAAIVQQIMTLEFVMPNGKKLRDCTGAEVARFGGIFTEIARHVKPTQVIGHHINARELQNICSRFEPARRSAARRDDPENRVSM